MKYLPKLVLSAIALWLLSAVAAFCSDLRVMTWDLEDAYPPEKAAVIAKALKKHKVDILAVQSVQTYGARFQDSIQAELDKVFGTGTYKHASTRGSRFDGNAVFWNTKTIQVGESVADISLKSASPNQTPVQLLRVKSGEFNFHFINVTLDQGDDEGEQSQIKQAGLLRNLLKKTASKDNVAIILAGNLAMGFPNEKVFDDLTDDYDVESNPAFHELNPDGFLTFCTRDIEKKNPRAFSFIGDLLESGRLVDHIAANAPAWKHYVKGSAQVVRIDKEFYDSLEDYEWNFSDHLPVLAEFSTK